MTIESAKRRLRELQELGVDVSKYKLKKGKRSVWDIHQSDLDEISKLRAGARPKARKKQGLEPLTKQKRRPREDVSLKTAKNYLKTMKDRGEDVSYYYGIRSSKWGVVMGFQWNVTEADIPTIMRLKEESDKREKTKKDRGAGIGETGGADGGMGGPTEGLIDTGDIMPTPEGDAILMKLIEIIDKIDVGTVPHTEEHNREISAGVEEFKGKWIQRVKEMYQQNPQYYAEKWGDNLEDLDEAVMKSVYSVDSDYNVILTTLSTRFFKLIGI